MSMPPSGYVDRPDYRVDVLRRRNLVTARIGDRELARSESTLLVDEQDHGLVFYFPAADVRLDQLQPIDRTSRCPYKGEASYWQLIDGEQPIAWTYREPYEQVALIRDHIAFYQDRVTVEIGVATPAVVGYPT
ncbi:MAG: DUF427 domain-containing protein [Frankiaceae bacterium]|nr:DUF427 domain-containing protein [Frankiaceae bacterium]